jgi:hypothetical protein
MPPTIANPRPARADTSGPNGRTTLAGLTTTFVICQNVRASSANDLGGNGTKAKSHQVQMNASLVRILFETVQQPAKLAAQLAQPSETTTARFHSRRQAKPAIQ